MKLISKIKAIFSHEKMVSTLVFAYITAFFAMLFGPTGLAIGWLVALGYCCVRAFIEKGDEYLCKIPYCFLGGFITSTVFAIGFYI